VQGFRKLKYCDFSTSYSITGNFLRSVVSNKALQEPLHSVHLVGLIQKILKPIFSETLEAAMGEIYLRS